MSTVNLLIGAREYPVACAPGEEAHVSSLGAIIDEKLESMPPGVDDSEVRMLLFAALLLADEVQELRQSAAAPAADPALGAKLAALAERIEQMAATAESAI